MLTSAERTDARRHMGYPAYGPDRTGGFGAFGAVEYRLSNLSSAELGVLREYLVTLGSLERAIPEAGAGLDTGSAAGWVRNTSELTERDRLFDGWRRRLCAFLGVPPGPALAARNTVALVV